MFKVKRKEQLPQEMDIVKRKEQIDYELNLYRKEKELGIDKEIHEKKCRSWEIVQSARREQMDAIVFIKGEIKELEMIKRSLKDELDLKKQIVDKESEMLKKENTFLRNFINNIKDNLDEKI